MIVQFETAVPRRNIVPSDSDEARKTATGHSCETFALPFKLFKLLFFPNLKPEPSAAPPAAGRELSAAKPFNRAE